jgi:hypothetical protein
MGDRPVGWSKKMQTERDPPTFRALIETLARRPVRTYMTEVGPEDVALEVFIPA